MRLLLSCALLGLIAPPAKAQFCFGYSSFGYRSSFSLSFGSFGCRPYGFGSYCGPGFCGPAFAPPPLFFAPPPAPLWNPWNYGYFAPPPIVFDVPPPPLVVRLPLPEAAPVLIEADPFDAPIVKNPPPGFLVVNPRRRAPDAAVRPAVAPDPADSAPLRLPKKVEPAKWEVPPAELPSDPPLADPKKEYRRLVERGRAAFRNRQYGLARERFVQAATLDESGADARLGLGHALTALGKYKPAADEFRRADAGDGFDPDALYAEGERERVRDEVVSLAGRLRDDATLAYLAERLK